MLVKAAEEDRINLKAGRTPGTVRIQWRANVDAPRAERGDQPQPGRTKPCTCLGAMRS